MSAEERDVAAAFTVVLSQLGGGGSTRFVAGSGLSDATRRALRTVRPIVEVGEVAGLSPKSAAGLPAGYFLVYSFTVTGNVASFEGTAGPVPAGPPNLNCGTGYLIELARVAGGWKIGKSSVIQC